MNEKAIALVAAALVVAAAAFLLSTRERPAPRSGAASLEASEAIAGAAADLPMHLAVPDAALIDQDGKPFRLSEWRGKVWVVDFIYVRCNGPCPMMSAQMRDLQKGFEEERRLRFLSVSVDPRNDTPEALRDYAEIYEAVPALWSFATGVEADILALERGLNLATGADAVEHSTRFVLVDERGFVRGYYDGRDEGQVKDLRRDIGRLLEKFRP